MTINKHEQKLSDKFKKHLGKNWKKYAIGIGTLGAIGLSVKLQSDKFNRLKRESQLTQADKSNNIAFGGNVRSELQHSSNRIEEISTNLLSGKYDSELELQNLFYEVNENLDKFKNKTLSLKEEMLYSKTLVYAEQIFNEIKQLMTNIEKQKQLNDLYD